MRLADGREVRARLTIAADGRASIVRAMLPLEDLGAPMDVFWFRFAKTAASRAACAAMSSAGDCS